MDFRVAGYLLTICFRNLPCCDHSCHTSGKLDGRSMSKTSKLMILIKVSPTVQVLFALATHKPLQLPCNYFLCSLACADLGVALDFMLNLSLPYNFKSSKARFVKLISQSSLSFQGLMLYDY